MIAVFSALAPDTFPTAANFQTVFGSQAVLLILTLALVIPLTVSEFDLSVAGVMSVAIVLIGYINVELGWSIGAAVAIALGFGVGVGMVHSILIVSLGLQSIIVTLGSGTLLLGVGVGINNQQISGVSDVLIQATRHRVGGLPLAFYYGVLLTLILWYLFSFTPTGRHLFFVGAGRNVARLSGIRVDRVRSGALIAASSISAFAGVVFAGLIGGASPYIGELYLLPAFAAAFLGATAITPGRFNPWGSFVAVYFLITGITGLEHLGLAGWIEQVFYGGALVVAVAISHVAGRAQRMRVLG